MEHLIEVVNALGATGLWAIVLYKVLDFLEFVGVALIVAYGIKKAWPFIKETL